MEGEMISFRPDGPHHALAAPMSMHAASFAHSISPMTSKSASTPPSHSQLLGKQAGFVLHHPTSHTTHTPSTIAPYGQSHSAPWTAQSQFVFPSPTFSNPPPLTSASCSHLSQYQQLASDEPAPVREIAGEGEHFHIPAYATSTSPSEDDS